MGAKIFDGQKWVDVYDTIVDNYSLLLVSTTDESFIGKTVTVTATGEGAKREQYTKRFTALNAQPFFRLNQITTYSVTCGDVTRTIEVTEYENYTVTISPAPSAGYLYDGSLGEAGETGANVCADITGGYTKFATVTYNSNNVTIHAGSNARGSSITTTNKIDCTGYSRLKFEATGTVQDCGISERMRDATYNYAYLGDYLTKCTQESTGIYSLDLTSYQGEYYVYIRNERNQDATITKIWLE